MSPSWQTVSVFISSTFNDMHAERDYLVKRVFPELREWCEKRKLRLVDIDLRWGVTEEDATKHKNVVKVCLDRIDECRPFFLCFLGQRRGWVPGKGDVSKETCETYKDLKDVLGKSSVTELEILHAAINPLNNQDRAKYSFFYLRDDSYLKDLPEDPPLIQKTFTNDGIQDPKDREFADRELRIWREEKIPATGRPVHHYSVTWNEKASTPELRIPLQCPSSNPENQKQWRSLWKMEAGIDVRDLDIQKHKIYAKRARKFNNNLCRGRLGNFLCEGEPLNEIILNDLKQAIEERFSEHREIPKESDLQKELDQQEQFLQLNRDGFIKRTGDFDKLNTYIKAKSRNLFVLTAPGGMGKTMLLANWIDSFRQKPKSKDIILFYRFIGASDRSTTVDFVIRFLLQEMKENSRLFDDEIPADPKELLRVWPSILEKIGKQRKIIIVIDAINQLESGLSDLQWIPWQVPEGIKFVISFKKRGECADNLYKKIIENPNVIVSQILPFENINDRKRLINAYLKQYLKKLDKYQIKEIINAPSSDNPLFLKVLLSELRIFGAYINLTEKLMRRGYGDTPVSAFEQVLYRLENDPVYSPIPPKVAVPLLFGLLSHARHGLSDEEFVSIFLIELKRKSTRKVRVEIGDTIRLFLRQVRPFLALREGRHDFFYESFRLAALKRYERKKDIKTKQLPTRRLLVEWHKSLADYFEKLPIWVSQNENIPTLRRAAELPYHLAWAGKSDYLANEILSYELLKTIVIGVGPYIAIEDISLILTPPVLPKKWLQNLTKPIQLIQDALTLSGYILAKKSNQLPSQLVGRLLGSQDLIIREFINTIKKFERQPWLCPVIPSLSPAGGPLIRILSDHTDSVTAIAMTSDGRHIISGSDDDTLKVWDLESGRVLHTLTGHKNAISAIALTRDNHRIISRSYDDTLKVWDLESGELINTINIDKISDAQYYRELVVSPDGQLAITHLHTNTLKVWDLDSGDCKHCLTRDSNFSFVDAAITPDGSRLITRSYDKTLEIRDLQVWDLDSGDCIHTLAGIPSFFFINAAITSDGSRLIAESPEETLEIWDVANRRKLHTFTGHSGSIKSIKVTQDCHRAVSVSRDNTLKVWDLENATILNTLKDHGHLSGFWAITPDGFKGISWSFDRILEIWDLEQGVELPNLKYIDIRGLLITPDGKMAITLAEENVIIKVWDIDRGKELQIIEGHANEVNDVISTPDGRLAISGSDDNTLKVWDLGNGQVLHTLKGHSGRITSVAATLDSRRVISGSCDNTLKIWDLADGTNRYTLEGHSSAVNDVIITPDGTRVISGSNDGTLKVWDLECNKEILTMNHGNEIGVVAVTPDGSKVILGSSAYFSREKKYFLKVWDLKSGRLYHTIEGHTGPIVIIAVTPDGRRALSGSLQNQVDDDISLMIWDLESGIECDDVDEPQGGVPCLSVTPDGRRVIFPVDDFLEICYLEDDHFFYLQDCLEGHTREITSLIVTPDGRRAISGSYDNALIVWDLEKSSIISEFHAEGCINVITSTDYLNTIISGDRNGQIHILRLEGITPGIPITTVKEFGDRSVRLRCHYCQLWFNLSRADLGSAVSCPACKKKMQVNPFTFREQNPVVRKRSSPKERVKKGLK